MTTDTRGTRPPKITPEQLHASHRWFTLDELHPLEGNPNLGDVSSLETSLDQFGWIDGIIVHRGTVIAGNHRVEQAHARGETGLPGYDLSFLEADTARLMAMALTHNATTRAGANDPELLLAAYELVAAELPDALPAVGYAGDPGQLVDMNIVGLGTPPALVDVDPAGFDFEHHCDGCGFRW